MNAANMPAESRVPAVVKYVLMQAHLGLNCFSFCYSFSASELLSASQTVDEQYRLLCILGTLVTFLFWICLLAFSSCCWFSPLLSPLLLQLYASGDCISVAQGLELPKAVFGCKQKFSDVLSLLFP